MRKKIPFSLFLLSALFLFGSEARGCGCILSFVQYQPCGAFWNSAAVFTGTVTEVGPMIPVTGTQGRLFTYDGAFVRFKIDEAFRGVKGDTVDIFQHGTSCDYGFKSGEQYFVYGSIDAKDGKIYVSSCSGTKTLDRAGDDLAYARGQMRNEPTPSIIGLVTRETRARADQYRKNNALEGIRVVASSAGATAEAYTDGNGIFRFFGLTAGNYDVRALTPAGLRRLYGPEVFNLKVTDQRCTGGQFTVTSLSSITGQVLNSDGAPLKTRLNLIAIDASGAEIISAEGSIEAYSDEKGKYKFDWLAPGAYLIAMNGRNQPGTHDPPYPRSYLPGVVPRQQAAIISVVEGQEVSVPDFQLPSPMIPLTVRGVAMLPDGTPAAHTLIVLEFTEREWIEITSADAQGRFEVKVYEGFKYFVAADLRKENRGAWTGTHSPRVQVIGGETNDTITLVVSQPGFYVPRYVELKRQRKQ